MSALSASLAPAAPTTPTGLNVTTVIDGVKRTQAAGAPPQPTPTPPTKERTMPRGVYERKPKASKATTSDTTTPKRKGRARKGPAPVDMTDLLAEMRRRRDALDAAIRALEVL